VLGPALRAALLLAAGVAAGCSSPGPSYRDEGAVYSPRVVSHGAAVPRGGGRHKLGKPYNVGGRIYVPRHEPGYNRNGIASWYGRDFHGRLTANGEVYDMDRLSAAHPTLPLPSFVRVTNLDSNRSIVVRVNDRGPFKPGRIIDLSKRAAHELGFLRQGTARVNVRYLGPAPL
jgi:rare lipoprotein A